jgi:thiosulfate dehydrogenase (quinone) large subunit
MAKRLSQWINDTPGAYLLILRGFLGVTFTFAGLQKLSNPGFFQAAAPGSIQQQLLGADRTSPISGLVGIALHQPVLIGVAIAICELIVGLATLAGLVSRAAATLGALLSLSFFLTVSFHSSPYYYGSDIVFLFAWTPLILGGAGALSVDALLIQRAKRPKAANATAPIGRRAAVGVLAGAAVVLGGGAAAIGRALNPRTVQGATGPTLPSGASTVPTAGTTNSSTPTSGTDPSGGTPKGTKIGPAADVPVGGAASFTDPASGSPAYALQPTAGHFTAFTRVCTHAGCTVNFDQSSFTFDCPCHGSRFDATNGAVLRGPASTPLPSIPIAKGSNDQLYVDG